MEYGKDKGKLLSGILAGVSFGVLNGVLALVLLNWTGWNWKQISMIWIMLILCMFPYILKILEKYEVPEGIAEILMEAVSIVICLLYVKETAMNQSALTRMIPCVLLVHGAGVSGILIQRLFNRKEKHA